MIDIKNLSLAANDFTKPTELCNLMGLHGSDKGHINITECHHNYTILYHQLFQTLRSKPIRLFELGLGTNNVRIPSNMGPFGRPGASLRAWSQYFHPDSRIYGADIDSDILFQEGNIQTYACDQTDPKQIQAMWARPELQEKFDILIEDGLHEFNANCTFFENSIHMLKPGGIYIIEDIYHSNIARFLYKIHDWEQRYPNHDFSLLPIPSQVNRDDNIVLVVHNKNS